MLHSIYILYLHEKYQNLFFNCFDKMEQIQKCNYHMKHFIFDGIIYRLKVEFSNFDISKSFYGIQLSQ